MLGVEAVEASCIDSAKAPCIEGIGCVGTIISFGESCLGIFVFSSSSIIALKGGEFSSSSSKVIGSPASASWSEGEKKGSGWEGRTEAAEAMLFFTRELGMRACESGCHYIYCSDWHWLCGQNAVSDWFCLLLLLRDRGEADLV